MAMLMGSLARPKAAARSPAVLLPAVLPEPVRRALGLVIIDLVEIEIALVGLDPAPRLSALGRLGASLREQRQARGPNSAPAADEAVRRVALHVQALAVNHPLAGEAAERADQYNPVPDPLKPSSPAG